MHRIFFSSSFFSASPPTGCQGRDSEVYEKGGADGMKEEEEPGKRRWHEVGEIKG